MKRNQIDDKFKWSIEEIFSSEKEFYQKYSDSYVPPKAVNILYQAIFFIKSFLIIIVFLNFYKLEM